VRLFAAALFVVPPVVAVVASGGRFSAATADVFDNEFDFGR
jgi:hypothetical protein